MKKNEIEIGSTYTAKITNRVVPVRIDATNPHGGWDATNLATKKKVRIKSAAKLRGVYRDGAKADPATSRAAKPETTTPTPNTTLSSVMKNVAAEDQSKTQARESATAEDVIVPAKAATMATVAKGRVKATTEATPARNATRANDAAKKAKAIKPKHRSGLDLAAKVLAESKEPLQAKAIAERAIAAGWKTNGKTPSATLYAAIIREITKKGKDARFKKTDRGLFAAAPKNRKGA